MNETLRLFDQFERTDTIPARRTEPIFHALNRLAWKNADRIRELLEGWFVTYPVPHKKALQSRYRSQSDSHHQGAFFELILFQFLTRLGHPGLLRCLTIWRTILCRSYGSGAQNASR